MDSREIVVRHIEGVDEPNILGSFEFNVASELNVRPNACIGASVSH